jgi:hypothetical protein
MWLPEASTMNAEITKIADLRRRIERGDYEIDPRAVADALIARVTREGGWLAPVVPPHARSRPAQTDPRSAPRRGPHH